MTFHYTDLEPAETDAMHRTPISVAPVIRWIEEAGAPAVAAAEIHALLTGGHPGAAADRCERLYGGLYTAWNASWGIRPGARLEMAEALNGIELDAIRQWLAASGVAGAGTRVQLQRLLHLVAECRVALHRIRGRRPGTRRSARDMHEEHPSRPDEAARAARVNAAYPAYHTRIAMCEQRDRYARDIARIRAAEDALAAEALPDDLDERDVRGGDALALYNAEVMPILLGWNPDVLQSRKSKRPRRVDEFGWEEYLDTDADAEMEAA